MSINIAAFSGSLRKESFTTKLVRAFQAQAPDGVSARLIPIGELPLLNEDLEANFPQVVTKMHEAVRAADAVLFATPEYNRSFSPVLKNAIDWGSRPDGNNVWDQKPVAIIGGTPYNLGAFGAQNQLRQVVMYVNMYPMQQPEFYLEQAADKFNVEGQLTDPKTKEKIDEVWQAFVAWIERVRD